MLASQRILVHGILQISTSRGPLVMVVSAAMARGRGSSRPKSLWPGRSTPNFGFLFCGLAIALLLTPASARLGRRCHGPHAFSFSFPDLTHFLQHLTLVGDASARSEGLEISGSQPQSVGGLFLSQPVRLRLPLGPGPGPRPSLSFSSSFSFSMDSNNGDGLAFVIAPSKDFKGMNGPWLGLAPARDGSPPDPPLAHTVAIEFDTSIDAEVLDPSENHVGLDIESLVSLATANVSDGLSLNDGQRLYAWVDYIAPLSLVEVRLSQSADQRPDSPILAYTIDLSNVWREEMFIGFSSSTGDLPQRHIIYSWSFATTGPQGPHGRPGWFGPGDRHPRHGDWHHGPGHWHHGPHDWHHGPHDWHPHRPDSGFPDWEHRPRPDGWHPEPRPYHHHEDEDSWLDGLGDVWSIVWALLFGVACGTIAAGVILAVWSFVQRRFSGDDAVENSDGGILYGYQTLMTSEPDSKLDASGYQKVPTNDEPEVKTVSS